MPRQNNLPLFKRKARLIKNLYAQGENSTDDDLVNLDSELSSGLQAMAFAVQELITIHDSAVDLDDLGRDMLACPNYVGLSLDAAFALATSENFAMPQFESVVDNTNPDGLIFEQNISAGVLLNRDTPVRIKVAQHDT